MKIMKNSIREQIFNLIREDILMQRLAMGEQINPREIAEENDISVMPVRDALLKLANQGLVVNRPRVGFFVKDFSVGEITNIMEVRQMYEIYCIRKHFDSIDLNIIKKLGKEVGVEFSMINREKFDRIDLKLHDSFISASGNSFLIKQYNQIKDFVILFQHLNPERMREAHLEHQKIIRLIVDNRQKSVAEVLEEHLKQVEKAVISTRKKHMKL